jgi:hypothetical protein
MATNSGKLGVQYQLISKVLKGDRAHTKGYKFNYL